MYNNNRDIVSIIYIILLNNASHFDVDSSSNSHIFIRIIVQNYIIEISLFTISIHTFLIRFCLCEW